AGPRAGARTIRSVSRAASWTSPIRPRPRRSRATVQDDTREIDDLLAHWLGPATADGSIPRDRAALWFGGGAATDRDVRTRFGDAHRPRGGGPPPGAGGGGGVPPH